MVTNNSKNQATGASGKVMQGQGVGTAASFSTATYPSTATGTGKILRADGTNWVASTATYPDTAGSNTNVLTSDGTNWSSSAAPATNTIYGSLGSVSSSPFDSQTYYYAQNAVPTFGGNAPTSYRFYAPISFTLNNVAINFTASSGGSSENGTLLIRVNDTTNTNIATNVQVTGTSNVYSFSSLGISISAGDFFYFGFITPAWATNPVSMALALAFSN